MGKTFKGKTQDAAAPFVGAEFWQQGVKLIGKVLRVFDSANGPCSVIRLAEPVKLNGESCEEVSIGNLKGFVMALQAAGLDRLQAGDVVLIECTGLSPTTKGHERTDFSVEVDRP